MKKRKIIFIVTIIIIVVFAFINYLSYKSELDGLNYNNKLIYDYCLDNENIDNDETKVFCEERVEEFEMFLSCESDDANDKCEELKKKYDIYYSQSFEDFLIGLLYSDFMTYQPFFCIILIAFIVYELSYYYTYSTIKNFLTRETYKKYIIRTYKSALKYIAIIPIFIFCTIIFAFILSYKLSFEYILSKEFICAYFLNVIFQTIFYINISLICTRGSKSYIITFVKTFIVYGILIYVTSNVSTCLKLFNIVISQINIFDLFHYLSNFSIYVALICSFVLVVVSYFIIYVTFKNKEKVLISLEKGELDYDN